MSWEAYVLLLVAGIVGGYLSGLLGIGGGIIYVFVIPYALYFWTIPESWQAQFTVANSLATIFFSSLAANYAHYQKGYFFPRPVFIIGFAAIVSSWMVLTYFVNTPFFSMKVFLCCLIILLGYMLLYTLKGAAIITDEPIEKTPIKGLLFIGVLSGAVAAASGLGGGIVVIPLLNRFFKISILKAGAISMGVIMLSSFVITVANATTSLPAAVNGTIGLIILPICSVLSISVLFVSPLGVASAINFLLVGFLLFMLDFCY
jgi:uncharacterized membrane protein YfcA